MFSPSPFPCAKSSLITLGYYQSAGSVQNVMELYRDVHKFEITLSSLIVVGDPFMDFELSGGLAGSAAGSAEGLQVFDSDIGDGANNANGFTNRQVKSSEYIPGSGEAPPKTPIQTTVCGEYPIHTYTNGEVSIVINFGRTITDGASYYPFVQIDFNNGMNNYNGQMMQGSVSFQMLSDLIIYGDAFGFAYGSIKVSERYSDIGMSKFYANENDSVTFAPVNGKKFSGFKDVTAVYVGGIKTTYAKNGDALNVTVPVGAKDDFVTFVAGSNKFFSPAILRIATPKS